MSPPDARLGLDRRQRFVKRSFDLVLSTAGLALTWWLLLLGILVATVDTRQGGLFTQHRVGKHGRLFRLFKLRTMRAVDGVSTTVTTSRDVRVTTIGRFFRRTKLDELPQLINVLLGDMSFVGPRPDVPGFADRLEGDDRIILSVRPGITGPATLAFRTEEELLADQSDPEHYNLRVIYPEKVRLNRDYVESYRFTTDLRYLYRTLVG